MKKGFTLIELLIIIGIITILAATIIIIITPSQRLQDARESTRISNMIKISSAINTALTDESKVCNGKECEDAADVLENCAVGEPQEFGKDCSQLLNLSEEIKDPQEGNYLVGASNGRIKIWSPAKESKWYCDSINNSCTGIPRTF